MAAGVPAKHAAEACGIDESTYWRWRQRGREGEEPFATFDSLAREASARWPIPLIDAIRRAAPEDWRAAAWILERRDPEHWGKRDGSAPSTATSEAKIILVSRPQAKPADA